VSGSARVRARRAAKRLSRLVTVPTSSIRSLPDFLIIGAQRAGTTSLYRYLCAHPGVLPAVLNKGIHYFDTNYEHGVGWYRSHFPSDPYRAWIRRREGVDRVITGEGSPYYVFHPLGPERISSTLPGARFILMLRDPVSRAYSQYQHEIARGFETLSFEEALEREEERLEGEAERLRREPAYHSLSHQHHSYVARGLYAEQIRRWHAFVPAERLLVLDSSEFFADPDGGYRRTLEFLGLPERSLPEYRQLNAHSYDRMSDRARRFLEDRFREPNRELVEYLGRRFSWAESRADGR
jgi:hypothetical protein